MPACFALAVCLRADNKESPCLISLFLSISVWECRFLRAGIFGIHFLLWGPRRKVIPGRQIYVPSPINDNNPFAFIQPYIPFGCAGYPQVEYQASRPVDLEWSTGQLQKAQASLGPFQSAPIVGGPQLAAAQAPLEHFPTRQGEEIVQQAAGGELSAAQDRNVHGLLQGPSAVGGRFSAAQTTVQPFRNGALALPREQVLETPNPQTLHSIPAPQNLPKSNHNLFSQQAAPQERFAGQPAIFQRQEARVEPPTLRAQFHAPPACNPIFLSPVSLPRSVGPRPTGKPHDPLIPERQYHSKALPNAPHILPFAQSAPKAQAVPFQNVPRGPFRTVNPPVIPLLTPPVNPFAAHQPSLLGNPQPARLMRNPQPSNTYRPSQNQYPGSLPFRPTGPLPPKHEAYRGNLGRGRGYTLRQDPFGHPRGDSFRFGPGGQGAGRGWHSKSGRGGSCFRGPVREKLREPEVSIINKILT
jgi:hypothetical protein